MTTFIPEWTRVSGRGLKLRSALGTLADDHVVRQPLRSGACPADFFVTHPQRGWLAVAIVEAPYAELDRGLFGSDTSARFEQQLRDLRALGLRTLVVLWACADDEAERLASAHPGMASFVARGRFLQRGAELADELAPIALEQEQALLARYFPEAEIPALCTTRHYFRSGELAGRHFLDPRQEWALKLDLDPPGTDAELARDLSVRLVNGVAGSGKTLIALHRALLMAELFPAQRVLMLIHNAPIVADLKQRLQRSRRSTPRNLEIHTFFGWLVARWQALHGRWPNLAGDEAMQQRVRRERARMARPLAQSDAQLADELAFIDEALLADEAAYLEASRAGRGFALRADERAQVWALHQAVTAGLERDGLHAWSALPRALADPAARLPRYDHVVIDEAQFFAPSWFEQVRTALQPGARLFLCADPNQGFLRSRMSWKSVGLEVAGRTRRLRRSYRTTRALLQAANEVLNVLGRGHDEDYLRPEFAGLEAGVPPRLIYAHAPQDAIDIAADELARLAEAAPLGALLLIYGDGIPREALYRRLCRRLGEERLWWFNHEDQRREPPHGGERDYLRMAHLASATGLEAAAVVLVGIEPLLSAEWPDEAAVRKLYMALTRAGQQLLLISSQPLPEAIEPLFEIAR